jgi:hypothetical protein
MKSFKQLFENHEEWLGTANPKDLETGEGIFASDGPPHHIVSASQNLHQRHNFTHDEFTSVNAYIGANNLPENNMFKGYRAINGHLRGTLHSDATLPSFHLKNLDKNLLDKHISNLDSAIAKHTTEHPIHLWRGFHRDARVQDLTPGDIFHDKGFVSTTTDPSYAKQMRHVVAHIKVPKGSKALAVNKYHFDNDWEHEVLLPRNSKFRYEGYTDHGTTRIHHLEHIPE